MKEINSASPSLAGRAATSERIVWLDVTRLICATMILGIHWLRASFKVGLFGANDPKDLVINYQGHNSGLGMLHYVLIADDGHSFSGWLTNLIGLLGEFGWEGVSALIIVSGFSLNISLKGRSLTFAAWINWLQKRGQRVLVPFYLVAIPFLVMYTVLLAVVKRLHGAFAHGLEQKLHSLLQTSTLGIVLSHTVLFDPFRPQWQADFFAPAWWFIPAILLAYLAFPILVRVIKRIGATSALLAAAAISISAYYLADQGVLLNETWYYIVLQELANFVLGIVVGNAWLRAGQRPLLERFFFSRWTFAFAFAMFIFGNVANWSPSTRPFASLLYGPGLLLMIIGIAKAVEKWSFTAVALRVDAYDFYLVHQPFAFPIALAAKLVLHGYAVFVGWFFFLSITSLAALLLSSVQRWWRGDMLTFSLARITGNDRSLRSTRKTRGNERNAGARSDGKHSV